MATISPASQSMLRMLFVVAMLSPVAWATECFVNSTELWMTSRTRAMLCSFT